MPKPFVPTFIVQRNQKIASEYMGKLVLAMAQPSKQAELTKVAEAEFWKASEHMFEDYAELLLSMQN